MQIKTNLITKITTNPTYDSNTANFKALMDTMNLARMEELTQELEAQKKMIVALVKEEQKHQVPDLQLGGCKLLANPAVFWLFIMPP